jgi:hypothetical protein
MIKNLIWTNKSVFNKRMSKAVFLVSFFVFLFFYSIFLPSDYTQKISFSNWNDLNAGSLTWGFVLSLALAWNLAIVVFNLTGLVKAAKSKALTPVSFVLSLLPSLLCCSPIIPNFLTFFGISGISLYQSSGDAEHFFATKGYILYAASLLLIIISGIWSLRKISDCQVGGICSAELTINETMEPSNKVAEV